MDSPKRTFQESFKTYHDVVYKKFKDRVKDKRKLTGKEYDEIFHELLELVPDGIPCVVAAIILSHGWSSYYETKGNGGVWNYRLINQ